jgi:SNF family Na+-dependent transporter
MSDGDVSSSSSSPWNWLNEDDDDGFRRGDDIDGGSSKKVNKKRSGTLWQRFKRKKRKTRRQLGSTFDGSVGELHLSDGDEPDFMFENNNNTARDIEMAQISNRNDRNDQNDDDENESRQRVATLALSNRQDSNGDDVQDIEMVQISSDRNDDDGERKDDDDELDNNVTIDNNDEQRQVWGSRWEFFFATVGFAVGVGNVWRFPMLAARNGGGAFLIPYMLAVIFLGVPLCVFELYLGKTYLRGPVALFQMLPSAPSRFGGVGVSSIVGSALVATYYIVLLAWSAVFLGYSFHSTLPWDGDDDFFEETVLNASASISHVGGINWWVFLAVTLAMLFVFVCVSRGVKGSGKVAIVTVTLPYLVLFVLFVRGVTLSGAGDGMLYFIEPDWSKLANFDIWVDAATQIMFSLSPAWGVLITFGSFLPRDEPVIRDACIIAGINSATSILAGLTVFAILGHLALEQGVDIEDLTVGGPALAFIVFPAAITTLPLPWLFAILFFVMLILLGIDSQFALVEAIMSAFDEAAWVHRLGVKRHWIAAGVCSALWLGSLVYTTDAGLYFVALVDTYVPMLTFFNVSLAQLICVGWGYSLRRFYKDARQRQSGHRVRAKQFWSVVWKFFVPALLIVLISCAVAYEIVEPTISDLPAWATVLGWTLALLPSMPMLYFAIWPAGRICKPAYAND